MFKHIGRLFQSGSKAGDSRKRNYATKLKSNPYACVEIKTRMDHCNAVEAYLGKRMLTEEAPWLPLSECDNDNCRCKFLRFDDRRADQRRDADIGISRRDYVGEDRRASIRGRRSSDLTAA